MSYFTDMINMPCKSRYLFKVKCTPGDFCKGFIQPCIAFTVNGVTGLAVSPGFSHNDQPENTTGPSGSISGLKYMKNICQFIHPILNLSNRSQYITISVIELWKVLQIK